MNEDNEQFDFKQAKKLALSVLKKRGCIDKPWADDFIQDCLLNYWQQIKKCRAKGIKHSQGQIHRFFHGILTSKYKRVYFQSLEDQAFDIPDTRDSFSAINAKIDLESYRHLISDDDWAFLTALIVDERTTYDVGKQWGYSYQFVAAKKQILLAKLRKGISHSEWKSL